LASGLTRNQVPGNRLGVRVPCPPLSRALRVNDLGASPLVTRNASRCHEMPSLMRAGCAQSDGFGQGGGELGRLKMGVEVHRQINRGVPGEFLSGFRVNPRVRQRSDVGVT
jgi:hypothetical protein